MTPEVKERIARIRRGEIPDGYRRGKLGVVPAEWALVPFRQMFKPLNRRNVSGNANVLTISAQRGLISQNTFFNKNIASQNTENYFLLQRGDFAYNKSYSKGYPFGALKPLRLYESGIVSPLYICFSPSDENHCPEYYAQYFDAGLMNQEIKAFAQEGARNHGLLNISTHDFFNSSLLFPTPAEQRKIADILSAQDSVIELQERLLAEKRRQKKYLTQRLFGEYQGEKRRIGEICEVIGGGTPDTRKAEYWNGEILWCAPSDFSKYGTKYIDDTEKRISQLGLESSSATMLPVGAVLLCSRATVGEARIAARPMCTNQGFQSMIANPGVSNEWLYYLIQNIKGDIIKLASGSTFLEISKSNFSNIMISVPSLEIQLKIAEILSVADREIDLLRASLEQERRKKKALSQLLLTGIVRV